MVRWPPMVPASGAVAAGVMAGGLLVNIKHLRRTRRTTDGDSFWPIKDRPEAAR